MLAKIGRLRMLRGLLFSNVLGLWSGHSCSSSPGSGPPRGSCSWVSSWSSGPTSFSCEPVWCRCAHEWSARCAGCNVYTRGYQMTMTWCIDDFKWSFLQGSQHHLRTCNHTKHLLHSLLQVVLMVNQHAHKMLQRYTKHPLTLFNLCITIYNLFIHF